LKLSTSSLPFFFHEVRGNLYGRYPKLFGEPEDESDGKVSQPDQRNSQEKLNDLIQYYFYTFMILTKENPLKLKKALKLDLHEALTFLSYILDKNEKEKQKLKKMKK
jgi:hypothetical protein